MLKETVILPKVVTTPLRSTAKDLSTTCTNFYPETVDEYNEPDAVMVAILSSFTSLCRMDRRLLQIHLLLKIIRVIIISYPKGSLITNLYFLRSFFLKKKNLIILYR
jgi:hypothetical protein